jgi:hypothetical protein
MFAKESEVGVTCHEADETSPVPWTATVIKGEAGSSLVMVREAFDEVALEAEKVTVKFLLAPGAS